MVIFESLIPPQCMKVEQSVSLTINSQAGLLLWFDWQAFSLLRGLKKKTPLSEKAKAICQCKCENEPDISRLVGLSITVSDKIHEPRRLVTSAAKSRRQCLLLTRSTVGHPAVSQSIINRSGRWVRTRGQKCWSPNNIVCVWDENMKCSQRASNKNYNSGRTDIVSWGVSRVKQMI